MLQNNLELQFWKSWRWFLPYFFVLGLPHPLEVEVAFVDYHAWQRHGLAFVHHLWSDLVQLLTSIT